MTTGDGHCLVLKMCLGPQNDWSLSSPRWSLSGPEISGPHNDQMVWSLSGPGRCLVLLHRVAMDCSGLVRTKRILTNLDRSTVTGWQIEPHLSFLLSGSRNIASRFICLFQTD